MKPVRKSVRTFLIKDKKVIAIRYTTNDYKQDFYDIPGGGIEKDETAEQTAIREFKEEAGMEIINPKYAGNLIIEYPDRIFDMIIFITSEYNGNPKETLENVAEAEWIEIDELLQKEKKFTEIYLLDTYHKTDLLNRTNFQLHFIADSNHNKLDEIYYSNDEKFWSEYLD